MPVPKELLEVHRPKNTICKMIGKKCAVIERIGCKRVNGKNIPQNGHVIGHIINGQYVPKVKQTLEITLKNYADFIYADKVGKDILNELKEVYGAFAIKIYVIAILRVLNPKLSDYQIEDEYEESFISEAYPNLALSKSVISKFIEDLGKDYSKALLFMSNRVDKIDEKDLIAIDGILSTNNSRINSLSEFSFKGKIKSSKDISQVVAFNVTNKEVICSIPYPGNTVDLVSFPDFIKKVGIKNGLIITDKAGEKIDNIGYIHPVKRNLKILDDLKLYDMDEKINNKENVIQCKKVEYKNKYYYSYRDISRAAKEKSDFIKSKKYSLEKLKKKENKFGTVVYVSDKDITLDEAYNIYKERWEIELINKYYNSEWILTVREHNDYSVFGTEFINMISTIIGCKIKNQFEKLGLFEKYTYGQIMKVLKRGKKARDPRNKDIWLDVEQSKKGKEILTLLGVYSV